MIRTLLLLASTIAVVTAIVPIVPITQSLPLGSDIIRGEFSPTSTLSPCSYTDSTAINATEGQVGCAGVTGKQTITWTFSNDKTRQVFVCK